MGAENQSPEIRCEKNHNNIKSVFWQPITLLLMLFDLVAVTASYFLALWLRFDCRFSEIPQAFLSAWA